MGDFVWRVYPSYRWVPAPAGTDGSPVLEPVGPNFREYEPWAEASGLFLTLVETEPTAEGVLAFASRFGHLGTVLEAPDAPPDPPWEAEAGEEFQEWYRSVTGDYRDRDRLADWRAEIGALRECKALWDGARSGKGATGIFWKLQARVNAALRRHDVRAALGKATGRGGLELRAEPVNLAGALWVQFARAVAGDKEFRRCATCGGWFEVGPEAARRHRQFCSEGCRSKAYRRRQDEARRLAADGKSAAEVAAELGSDEATVAAWLRGPARAPKGEEAGDGA